HDRMVFTTHTPIEAGNEQFDEKLFRDYFEPYANLNGLDYEDIKKIFLHPSRRFNNQDVVCMADAALELSCRANAVAKSHARVSRTLYKNGDKIIPITNAVHRRFWQMKPMQAFLEGLLKYAKSLGHLKRMAIDRLNEEQIRQLIGYADPDKYLAMRKAAKKAAIEDLRQKRPASRLEGLDEDALTIVVARRAAPYKRLDLVLRRIERLREEAEKRGVKLQIVFAGKAHPADNDGKEIIRRVNEFIMSGRNKGDVFFVENYDIDVAKGLISMADIWLNNPIPPLEASGTSGMKAGLCGAVSVSTPDGWVLEAENAWDEEKQEPKPLSEIKGAAFLFKESPIEVKDDKDIESANRRDEETADNMLKALTEVMEVYANNKNRWAELSKNAVYDTMAHFTMGRFAGDYERDMYLPSLRESRALAAATAAKGLVAPSTLPITQSISRWWYNRVLRLNLGEEELLRVTALEIAPWFEQLIKVGIPFGLFAILERLFPAIGLFRTGILTSIIGIGGLIFIILHLKSMRAPPVRIGTVPTSVDSTVRGQSLFKQLAAPAIISIFDTIAVFFLPTSPWIAIGVTAISHFIVNFIIMRLRMRGHEIGYATLQATAKVGVVSVVPSLRLNVDNRIVDDNFMEAVRYFNSEVLVSSKPSGLPLEPFTWEKVLDVVELFRGDRKNKEYSDEIRTERLRTLKERLPVDTDILKIANTRFDNENDLFDAAVDLYIYIIGRQILIDHAKKGEGRAHAKPGLPGFDTVREYRPVNAFNSYLPHPAGAHNRMAYFIVSYLFRNNGYKGALFTRREEFGNSGLFGYYFVTNNASAKPRLMNFFKAHMKKEGPDMAGDFAGSIQSDFFAALKQEGLLLPKYARQECIITSNILAEILSARFNIPIGGNDSVRIEIIPGYYKYKDALPVYHQWIAVYTGDEEPSLYIDASFGQFESTYKDTVIVRPYFEKSKNLIDSRSDFLDTIATLGMDLDGINELSLRSEEVGAAPKIVIRYNDYLHAERIRSGKWVYPFEQTIRSAMDRIKIRFARPWQPATLPLTQSIGRWWYNKVLKLKLGEEELLRVTAIEIAPWFEQILKIGAPFSLFAVLEYLFPAISIFRTGILTSIIGIGGLIFTILHLKSMRAPPDKIFKQSIAPAIVSIFDTIAVFFLASSPWIAIGITAVSHFIVNFAVTRLREKGIGVGYAVLPADMNELWDKPAIMPGSIFGTGWFASLAVSPLIEELLRALFYVNGGWVGFFYISATLIAVHYFNKSAYIELYKKMNNGEEPPGGADMYQRVFGIPVAVMLGTLFVAALSCFTGIKNTFPDIAANFMIAHLTGNIFAKLYSLRYPRDILMPASLAPVTTRQAHDLYHSNISQEMRKISDTLDARLKIYGLRLGSRPHRGGIMHYDIEKAIKDIVEEERRRMLRAGKVDDDVDGQEIVLFTGLHPVKLWLEDGIVVILNPGFDVDHAGRNELTVYARKRSKVIHEKSELKGWMHFAESEGIASEEDIVEKSVLGDRIMEWANKRDAQGMLVNKDKAAEARKRLHQSACRKELEYLLTNEWGLFPTASGEIMRRLPNAAIEYIIDNGLKIEILRLGSPARNPDLLDISPDGKTIDISYKCLAAHTPQWFEHRILNYIHFRRLLISYDHSLEYACAVEFWAEYQTFKALEKTNPDGAGLTPDLKKYFNACTAWVTPQLDEETRMRIVTENIYGDVTDRLEDALVEEGETRRNAGLAIEDLDADYIVNIIAFDDLNLELKEKLEELEMETEDLGIGDNLDPY
ncbi:MAG: alpha-glucan family phosphorylase, partial [Candidatus Omnitrophica bacterium]|nr:alpha-glucan family phosphorylase [Candidatus Omnitrophota bacterium]